MRRLLDWIGGALAGIGLYRLFQRRGAEPDLAAEPGLAEDPEERAEALRAKLDEVRASETPSPTEPGEPQESVEERRRRVHDEGRAAIDEMGGSEG